jgi:hypothetical protein
LIICSRMQFSFVLKRYLIKDIHMANLTKEWTIFKSWNVCQWMIVDLFYLHLCIMRNDYQCGFKVCNRIYLCKINTKLYSYCRCKSHSFYEVIWIFHTFIYKCTTCKTLSENVQIKYSEHSIYVMLYFIIHV